MPESQSCRSTKKEGKNDKGEENRSEKRTEGQREQKGKGNKICPGTELNRRHGDFQSPALPTELPGRVVSLKGLT